MDKNELMNDYEQLATLLVVELLAIKAKGYSLNATEVENYFTDSRYRVSYDNPVKKRILSIIYNNPYLLYELEFLDVRIKKMIPKLILSRYDDKIDEIRFIYESKGMTKEEFNKNIDSVNYCYFDISDKSKSIKKYC